MSLAEFELINAFFTQAPQRPDVKLGVGDDAAIVESRNSNVAISTDTLVSGVHFPVTTHPADIAYKALAVNLSDLAAMGATPAWFSLSIALPEIDNAWLESFAKALSATANHHNIDLIGGDTCYSPHLVITITIQGLLPGNKALRRDSACSGDLIYVSGSLGDAAAGLKLTQGTSLPGLNDEESGFLIERLNRPEPRVKLGRSLLACANAAIDISDGLLSDLNHILSSSQCGAEIDVDKLPISASLKQVRDTKLIHNFALNGGDDYELCFSISPDKQQEVAELSKALDLPLACIGRIVKDEGLWLINQGKKQRIQPKGFEHFKV